MSTDAGDNQGKTAFVKEYLKTHREAYHRTISDAWNAAGNPGTISESLVGKMRRTMGLTGRRERDGDGTSPEAKNRGKSSSKSQGAKRGAKSGAVSSPARGRSDDPGGSKTAFVLDQLERDPESNPRTVNDAWMAAGREGTISETMVYKVKRDLGLSGDKARSGGGRSSQKSTAGAPKTAPSPRTSGPTPSGAGGASAASRHASASTSAGREGVLDRVEDGIDDLIVELKQVGGMDDALEALRKARRVVVRNLEG